MDESVIVRRLLDAGYSPVTLAHALGVEVDDLVEIASTPVVEIVGDDDALRNAARTLVWRVINETFRILDEGSPQTRMAVISKLSGPLFRMVSASSGTDLDEMRDQMAELTRVFREHLERDGQPADDPVEIVEDRAPEAQLGTVRVLGRDRAPTKRGETS